MTDDLSWGENIASATGKAQQRLFHLRELKEAKLPHGLMMNFYQCVVECADTWTPCVVFQLHKDRLSIGW